jgi:hypothetical protein
VVCLLYFAVYVLENTRLRLRGRNFASIPCVTPWYPLKPSLRMLLKQRLSDTPLTPVRSHAGENVVYVLRSNSLTAAFSQSCRFDLVPLCTLSSNSNCPERRLPQNRRRGVAWRAGPGPAFLLLCLSLAAAMKEHMVALAGSAHGDLCVQHCCCPDRSPAVGQTEHTVPARSSVAGK